MGSIIRGMATFLSRLRSGAIDLSNARYERRVADINRRHKYFTPLDDEALQRQAAAIRQQVQSGTRLDNVVNDAFAIVKEAARRTVGMQPYDVQLLAALGEFGILDRRELDEAIVAAVKDAIERVIILRRNRIVFMVMAARALHGQRHRAASDHVDAVVNNVVCHPDETPSAGDETHRCSNSYYDQEMKWIEES
jgi:fumarate reductase subunit D